MVVVASYVHKYIIIPYIYRTSKNDVDIQYTSRIYNIIAAVGLGGRGGEIKSNKQYCAARSRSLKNLRAHTYCTKSHTYILYRYSRGECIIWDVHNNIAIYITRRVCWQCHFAVVVNVPPSSVGNRQDNSALGHSFMRTRACVCVCYIV